MEDEPKIDRRGTSLKNNPQNWSTWGVILHAVSSSSSSWLGNHPTRKPKGTGTPYYRLRGKLSQFCAKVCQAERNRCDRKNILWLFVFGFRTTANWRLLYLCPWRPQPISCPWVCSVTPHDFYLWPVSCLSTLVVTSIFNVSHCDHVGWNTISLTTVNRVFIRILSRLFH